MFLAEGQLIWLLRCCLELKGRTWIYLMQPGTSLTLVVSLGLKILLLLLLHL
jgi:hypothetical protein